MDPLAQVEISYSCGVLLWTRRHAADLRDEELTALAEGSLPADEALGMRGHLAGCASCRAVLCELCCGHPPHRGSSLRELYRLVRRSPATPLREEAPGVDPAFAEVVYCVREEGEEHCRGNAGRIIRPA